MNKIKLTITKSTIKDDDSTSLLWFDIIASAASTFLE